MSSITVKVERVPDTIDITLDRLCWTCDGAGKVETMSVRSTCDTCHGTGWQLTDEGEEIASFIERHFHILRK